MLGRALTAILASSLLLPAGVAAQSNSPDPDSPAGVEYELPLDQTRKDLSSEGGRDPGRGENGSSPGDSGGGGGDGAAPLFGAGISREAASGDGQESSNGDGAEAGAGDGPSAGGDGRPGPAVTKASTGEDGSTGLLLPGLALLVILAGAAMGLLLRRGLGSSGS